MCVQAEERAQTEADRWLAANRFEFSATRLTFRSVPHCKPFHTFFFFGLSSSFILFIYIFHILPPNTTFRPLTQQQPTGRSFLTALNLLSALTVDSVIFPLRIGLCILPSLPIIPNKSPSSKQHVSSLALRFPTLLPSHHRFRIRAISPLRYASTHEVNLNALENLLATFFFPLALPLPPLLTTQPNLHQNPDTLSLSCLQKVARHQGLCVAPSRSPGPLARSSSLPVENVQITGFVSTFYPPSCATSAFFFKAMR